MNVLFKHRSSLPVSNITSGCFYWIGEPGNSEVWFAPDNVRDHMVCLSEKGSGTTPEEIIQLINRVNGIESEVGDIREAISNLQEILGNIDLSSYLTDEDLKDYVTSSELEQRLEDYNIEIDGSDVDDIIDRKVTERLHWTVI